MGMSRYIHHDLITDFCDKHSQTFHISDITNHEQVARALLEAKANIEAVQNQGFTSLMLSAQHGYEQVCMPSL